MRPADSRRLRTGCAVLFGIGLLLLSVGPAWADAPPVMVPGSGWNGVSPQPEAVGDPGARGIDAMAIARFDVVPAQTFDGQFEVGVVAFHINRIDRVEFAVDGGPWVAVDRMTLNPRTGVWEYWAVLDASAFPDDGPVEVRAIAWPTVGIPRVLQADSGHELVLYANGGGTLHNTGVALHVSPADGSDDTGTGAEGSPYATWHRAIRALNESGGCGGATIYLHEGTYTYDDDTAGDGTAGRWLTVAGAPGVPREAVVLSGDGSGVLQRWLHIKGVRIDHSLGDAPALELRSGPYGNKFWIDGCELAGRDYQGDDLSRNGFVRGGTQYHTDNQWHDHKSALGGRIVRNIEAWNLSGDFLGSRSMFINCHLRHMRPAPGVHPDVYQVYAGSNRNIIIYGLKALDVVSQGINIGQGADVTDDVAVVNCLIEQRAGAHTRNFLPAASAGTSNHVVLWHHTMVNISTTDSYTGQRNLDTIGCVFGGFSHAGDGDISGWRFDQNHFGSAGSAIGTNSSAGDPQYVAKATWDGDTLTSEGDYRPAVGSPLVGRVAEPLVPIDVDGNLRGTPTAAGAMVAVAESSFSILSWQLPVAHGPAGTLTTPLEDGYVEPRDGAVTQLRIELVAAADPATVVPGAVTISGATGGDLSGAIADLALSDGDRVLTVTLGEPLAGPDRYTVTLNASVHSASGMALSGDRSRTFSVLVGDIDGSGSVGPADAVSVRDQAGATVDATTSRYDVDRSGTVTGADMQLVQKAADAELP